MEKTDKRLGVIAPRFFVDDGFRVFFLKNAIFAIATQSASEGRFPMFFSF